MRNADLRAVVDRFARARVALVGDLVADEYLYGETDRISREAPVLIVRYEESELRLGCGANAAATANLRRWGFRAANAGERMRLGSPVAWHPERQFGLFNLFWG